MYSLPADFEKITSDTKFQKDEILYIRSKYGYENLWSRSIAAYYAEKDINKSGNYEVLSINYNDDPGYFWFKVKVVNNNPAVQTASFAGLVAVVLAIAVVGLVAAFKTAEIFRDKKITTMANAVASGNTTVEEMVLLDETVTNNQQGVIAQTGEAVQKAGTGLFLAIAAIGGVLYYLKKRG